MKKTYVIYSLVLLNVSLACSQKENHPPIEDFNKDLYSLEKIVDGIDIPWGMSFTSNNSFLVTDKKGILYHVSDGKKVLLKELLKLLKQDKVAFLMWLLTLILKIIIKFISQQALVHQTKDQIPPYILQFFQRINYQN
jgi:hypothetical protein